MRWSNKGFTLLEVLLAILIVGTLAGAISAMIVASLATEEAGRVEEQLADEFSVGLSMLLSDLRNASRLYECQPDSVGLTLWAGPVVGTTEGVFLFDPKEGVWLQRNGTGSDVIPAGVAVRSLLAEETGTIFAGGSDGAVYKSTNCGISWQGVPVGTGPIVAIARASDGTLYCLQGNSPAVYKSTDDGVTWTPCAALPDAPGNAYALLCYRNSIIVGTDWNGYGNIYCSDDGGASWQVYAAMLDKFMFHRVIRIRNRTSKFLREYQVPIEIKYEPGKMRPDFGDIRFSKVAKNPPDEEDLLPYWLEHYDSNSAVFWVKVPQIRPRATVTIHLYYGNPNKTSLSNITATMESSYQIHQMSYNNAPSEYRIPRPRTRLLTSGGKWVDFGFKFPFWHQMKERAYVAFWGYMLFDPTAAVDDNTPSSEEFHNRCMIAAFWDNGRALSRTDGTYWRKESDRVTFEWRFGKRILWLTGSQRTRCQIRRNGDIIFYTVAITRPWLFSPIAIGVSKGDGTSYATGVPENTVPDAGQWWLFSLRKWVYPEPAVTIRRERQEYFPNHQVLYFCVTPDGSKIYAGTAPDGLVFFSSDGKVWQLTQGTFTARATWTVGAENDGRVIAGTSDTATIYFSPDGGATWNNLQQVSGATAVLDSVRGRNGRWFAVSNTGVLLRCNSLGQVMDVVGTAPPGNAFCVATAYKRVLYRLNNGQIERISDGATQILARDIDSLQFTYYNDDLVAFSPTTQSERDGVAVVRVKYSLTRENRSLERSSAVAVRNLP